MLFSAISTVILPTVVVDQVMTTLFIESGNHFQPISGREHGQNLVYHVANGGFLAAYSIHDTINSLKSGGILIIVSEKGLSQKF
jgi:hypothetical protein